MLSRAERAHTVIDEAGGTAPYRNVTAFETQAAHRIGAAFAAPKKDRRQTERDGDDRSPCIVLVAVPMQTQFGAHHVAVDQASVRIIIGESGLGSGLELILPGGLWTNASGKVGHGTPVSGSRGS